MNILNKSQGVAAFTVKKSLSALAISVSLMTLSVAAADSATRYDNLAKQLTIMDNIFKSSLQAQDNKKLSRAKVNSLYLAGQGVVFTVSSASSFMWSEQGFNFVMPDIVAPVAPLSPGEDSNDFVYFSDDENVVIQIESTREEQQEHYRDIHEQQRDLAYDLRDLARESKELHYQLRHVDEKEQLKLKAEQKALTERKVVLEKSQKSLAKKSKQMQVQQQKQQAKKQQQRSDNYALLSASLVETLCTYGNSLKALPSNEHVSLIIKSAGDKTGRSGHKDQIYVFNKKDITACANDKITTTKLSSGAMNYQF